MSQAKFVLAATAAIFMLSSAPAAARGLHLGRPITVSPHPIRGTPPQPGRGTRPQPGRGAPGPDAAAGLSFLLAAAGFAWMRRQRRR